MKSSDELEDGVLEEKLIWNISYYWYYLILEVEPLMWMLLDICRQILLLVFCFFGFIYIYIYFSLLSSVFILTQCAVTYWCSIISFTLSAQVSILNKDFIMMLFISIFTINLSCNDILFCLFKISFVCWQWLLNRHYLKFK